MPASRRDVLRLSGSLGLATVGGCAAVPGIDHRLSLVFLNFDDQRHLLDLEVLRTDATERSEAVVFHEEFELPPLDAGAQEPSHREPDVLESQRYLLRASLSGNRSVRAEYDFYPDCTGDDEPPEELYVAVHESEDDPEPYIAFQQNRCGSNSWWI